MLSILRNTTYKVSLPYGTLLITIFENYRVQLTDELQMVELKKSDALGNITFKRMGYIFQNGVWIPKGGIAHDDDVNIEIDDILGEQEGGDEQNAPTHEEEHVHHGPSSQPPSGNYEEHFNMVNARLDTLVKNFDAFKIDQANSHT